MSTVNKIQIVGRLGQEPDVKVFESGSVKCTFSVATNYKEKGEEKVFWHRVEVWGKQAEACGEYLKKGALVFVEGRLDQSEWVNKEGQTVKSVYIVGRDVKFLSQGQMRQDNLVNHADKVVDKQVTDDINNVLPPSDSASAGADASERLPF